MDTSPSRFFEHDSSVANRLPSHYVVIGRALLENEKTRSHFGFRSPAAFGVFREGVAFVPTEALESYLEDLLDLATPIEQLCIVKKLSLLSGTPISLGGLFLSFSIGLLAAKNGATLPAALLLAIFLALPFAILWHVAPNSSLARRLRFAQFVSHEIARRRGRDGDSFTEKRPRLRLWESALGSPIVSRLPTAQNYSGVLDLRTSVKNIL